MITPIAEQPHVQATSRIGACRPEQSRTSCPIESPMFLLHVYSMRDDPSNLCIFASGRTRNMARSPWLYTFPREAVTQSTSLPPYVSSVYCSRTHGLPSATTRHQQLFAPSEQRQSGPPIRNELAYSIAYSHAYRLPGPSAFPLSRKRWHLHALHSVSHRNVANGASRQQQGRVALIFCPSGARPHCLNVCAIKLLYDLTVAPHSMTRKAAVICFHFRFCNTTSTHVRTT